jgi:TonB family protein
MLFCGQHMCADVSSRRVTRAMHGVAVVLLLRSGMDRPESSPRAHLIGGVVAIALLHASATTGGQTGFVSAQYVSGELPVAPVLAVSGGDVFLEVLVGVDGRVGTIRTLRTTPPFTEAVINAVRGWQFQPATEGVDPALIRPVAAPVFVAAMFAPPALNGPTLGQPPTDTAAASSDTPMPIAANPAGYPPRALGDGTVLVDVTIDGSGALTDAQVKVSSPGFDASAIAAARSWAFRGAQRNRHAVTTHACLMFVFRQPVTALR